MASAITHFVVGAALALPAMQSESFGAVITRWMVPVSSGLLAVAPDFDTFAMRAFDIPFGSFFGHRGFFHSPLFLALVSSVLAALLARRHAGRAAAWIAVTWAGCAITHPLLDALTDGGSGVLLLFPFSDERLFFPWRPIHVSPLGIRAFFNRAGYILWSEAPFDAAAVALGIGGLWVRSKLIK